jgi:hypothetical protein
VIDLNQFSEEGQKLVFLNKQLQNINLEDFRYRNTRKKLQQQESKYVGFIEDISKDKEQL